MKNNGLINIDGLNQAIKRLGSVSSQMKSIERSLKSVEEDVQRRFIDPLQKSLSKRPMLSSNGRWQKYAIHRLKKNRSVRYEDVAASMTFVKPGKDIQEVMDNTNNQPRLQTRVNRVNGMAQRERYVQKRQANRITQMPLDTEWKNVYIAVEDTAKKVEKYVQNRYKRAFSKLR